MAKQAAVKKTASAQVDVPKGYWVDAQGKLTHESLVNSADRARDALVKDLVVKAKAQSETLGVFKTQAMDAIAGFIEQSASEFEIKLGGRKGNVTLFSYDGRFKIIRANQDRVEFDERLLAAKALIEECLADWSKNARHELKAIVQRAFDVDKEGKVNVSRVLTLRRVDIQDDRWLKAMKALSEALQVVSSKSYIRVYERDKNGEYQPIPLDVASA